MSRHISPEFFYNLPSGNKVHPCRLIHKDGTLMWKHALLYCNDVVAMPETQAHEQHIIKTAQRLEELNSWVSINLNPWEFLRPLRWYDPTDIEFSEGISVVFKHTCLDGDDCYEQIKKHIQEHETLEYANGYFKFSRC